MKDAKVEVIDQNGKVFVTMPARFWNAKNDPEGPCICLLVEKAFLGLDFQITLGLDDVRKVLKD